MKRRNSQAGVTLIELMIVVGIIAVFAALMFGLNSQTYGAASNNVADQLAQDLNTCKMRAVSTRRWHRCEITPTSLTMMQWQVTGMTVPATGSWGVISVDNIPNGVTVWGSATAVCAIAPCGTAPTAANTSLVYDFDFRPDGSSVGGTIFITDPGQNKKYRVVVYKATGSSYARNSW